MAAQGIDRLFNKLKQALCRHHFVQFYSAKTLRAASDKCTKCGKVRTRTW